MAKITIQIPEQNFELIRNKLGVILTDELSAQTVATDIDVWLERIIPFDHTELPAINVSWDNVSYDNHNPKTRRGENQYFIDIHINKPHTDSEKGDIAASKFAQRIAGIVAYILSSAEYRTLDFDPGLINSRWVNDISIGRIQDQDALHTVVARITLKVIADETVGDLTGVAGEIFTSEFKLDETDKGFLIKKET